MSGPTQCYSGESDVPAAVAAAAAAAAVVVVAAHVARSDTPSVDERSLLSLVSMKLVAGQGGVLDVRARREVVVVGVVVDDVEPGMPAHVTSVTSASRTGVQVSLSFLVHPSSSSPSPLLRE